MEKYYTNCCHCRKGIAYGIPYNQCAICELEYCASCAQSVHPKAHKEVEYTVTSFPTALDAPYNPQTCLACKTLTHCHIKCVEADCNFLLCGGCFCDSLKQGLMHEHNVITSVELAHRTTNAMVGKDCHACKQGRSYAHCSRCLGGIRQDTPMYECRDCLRMHEDPGALFCEPCYEAVMAEESTPAHNFMSTQYAIVKDEEDDKYYRMKCLECEREFSEWNAQTLGRHAHDRWECQMGPLKAEEIRGISLRSCPRRNFVTEADAIKPEEQHSKDRDLGCSFCWKKFRASATTHFCGSCAFIACDDCKTSGKLHHPHLMVPMILSYRPLDLNFWRDLLEDQKDWTCDGCSTPFYSKIQRYVVCNACKNYGFCDDCMCDHKIAPGAWKHDCASPRPDGKLVFAYMDVEDCDDEYSQRMIERATSERDRLQEEAEAQERRDAEAARRQRQPQHQASAQRKAVTRSAAASSSSSSRVTTFGGPPPGKAAAAAAPRVVRPAPVPAKLPVRPAPRQQHSSGTSQLLKAVGVGLVKGLVQANRASGNSGGGWSGGGDAGGDTGVDLNSANMMFQANMQQNMWDSVNSAANWNVQ